MPKLNTRTLLLFCCLLFPGLVVAQEEEFEQIDYLFQALNENTPGAVVTIVKDGEVLYTKGYGMASLEYNLPMTPYVTIEMASVSKQFTAFAVLLLAEEGKLSLDDDVRKYIPELPDYGDVITLRHLATHTSGLREWIQLFQLSGYQLSGDPITQAHIFNLITHQEGLNFKPGEQFNYSNTNFELLAMVVERVSGMSFAEFTKQRIFKPLDMEHTFFNDDYNRIIPNLAGRYYWGGEMYKSIPFHIAMGGAEGLFTTIVDFSKWMLNFETMQVGNTNLFKTFNTPGVLNNGDTISAALGQFIEPYRGLYQIQHSGGGVGMNSHLSRFPEQRFAVAVTCNDDEASAQGLALQIADIFLKDDFLVINGTPKMSNQVIAVNPSMLNSYEADYWSADVGLSRKIYVETDTLRYARTNGYVSTLLPISQREFIFADAVISTRIRFDRNAANQKTMEFLLNNDPPNVFVEYEPITYTTEELKQFTGKFFSQELNAIYDITLDEDVLVARHFRQPDILLKEVMTDTFTGARTAFSQVQFTRAADGGIDGCIVSSRSAKGITFVKMNDRN